jgi:hypothetical protein
MTLEEVNGKFRECAQGVLSFEDIDKTIRLLSKLEDLVSVDELMALLSKTKL